MAVQTILILRLKLLFRTTITMFSISKAETVNNNTVLTANTRFLLKGFVFSLFCYLNTEQCDETQLYCL